MSERADYIAALQVQRENLARHPASPTQKRRLSEVDAEIDQYAEKPKVTRKETAVPKSTASKSTASKSTASKS